MPDKITTIKLSVSTKERLEKFRVYKRETYEEILRKIFDMLNICKVEPEKARSKLLSLDRQNKQFSKENKQN